jgi:uncharacterized membrane protein
MNEAHLHLTFNHLPIIIPIIGLLIMIGGILLKSEVIKRTAYAVFILGALATIPAFASGEGAEEIAENLPEVTHHLIHEHEEVAETFALLSYLLGGISLIGLWSNWKQKSLSNVSTYITALLSVIVISTAKKTGTTGGEIRHTEIRSSQDASSNTEMEHEEADEDEH